MPRPISRLRLPSPRQAGLYLTGVVLVSLGATFGLRSGMGGSPYDALLVTLSGRLGVGLVAVAWGLQVLWAVTLHRLGRRPAPGAIAHSLLFGPLISLGIALVPPAHGPAAGLLYTTLAIAGLSVGLHLYLSAAYLSSILDGVFEAASRRFQVSDTALRRAFDAGCVAYAWIGGGPVGVGTIALAFGVGRVLGWIRRGAPTPRSWRGIGLVSRPADESAGFADQARRYAEGRRIRYVVDTTSAFLRR